jgi:hypothetical protein
MREALLGVLVAVAACGAGGSTAGSAGGGGAGDGKYHPPTNGTPMSEADACNALSAAADTDHMTLGCVSTSQPCPNLLRVEFSTPCLEYDQGTVEGCVAYYGMASSCTSLASAIAACAISPIAGSAPKGCP